MPLSCTVLPGSTPGTFKVAVDGTTPAMLWIKWYSTTAAVITDPTLTATPYEDSGGNFLVNAMQGPTFPYTSADTAYPAGTRWVMALTWTLDPTNPTLNLSIDKREFSVPTTTSTSSSTSSTSSTSTSSSTTESSTTGSSTTSSSTTASSTTSGSSGMATWTWQNVGGVNQWVLTTACSSGTASPPGFNGMMPGDTAQTSCS